MARRSPTARLDYPVCVFNITCFLNTLRPGRWRAFGVFVPELGLVDTARRRSPHRAPTESCNRPLARATASEQSHGRRRPGSLASVLRTLARNYVTCAFTRQRQRGPFAFDRAPAAAPEISFRYAVDACARTCIAAPQHGLSSSSSTKAHQSPLRRGRGTPTQIGGWPRRGRLDLRAAP